MKKRFLNATLLVLCAAPFCTTAQAAVLTWDGDASTLNWFDATNWSGDAEPTSADEVQLDASGVTISAATASAQELSVGYSGTGTLAISGGGAATSDTGHSVYVGNAVGSDGTITVTGTGSTLGSGGTFYVGHSGDGSLTVSAGGQASSATSYRFEVGVAATGNGTVVVTGAGSSIESGSAVLIGDEGVASLSIEDGGTMSSATGGSFIAGNSAGGDGTITVTGAGSTLTSGGAFDIGSLGDGSLTVSAGGRASSATGYDLEVGVGATGTGTVVVTGAGSSLGSGGAIVIGDEGVGSLSVENGGAVHTATGFNFVAGKNTGGDGTVTVTSAGSEIVSGGGVYIGQGQNGGGTGTLTVSNGGLVSSAAGYLFSVGDLAGSTGTITVTGAGSKITSADAFYVGRSGTGTLTVSDGGSLEGAYVISIAQQVGSTGTLNIGAAHGDPAAAPGTVSLVPAPNAGGGIVFGGGTGKLVFNHTSDAYTFGGKISGTGTIQNDAGVTILTGDLSYFTGLFDIEGGTLQIAYAGSDSQTLTGSLTGSGTYSFTTGTTYLTGDSSAFAGTTNVSGTGILSVNGSLGGTVNITSGGRLQGTGTVGTTEVGTGSTVAPGNSIGTLNVDGDIHFSSGSTYVVEADATSSDKIVVTGRATIDSWTVNLVPYNGATLHLGTRYTILTATTVDTGAFAVSNSDLFTLGNGSLFYGVRLSYEPTSVYATIAQTKDFASVAVNANQAEAARAAQALGDGNALHDAIAMQTDETTVRRGFQSLAGEAHANIKATLLDDQAAQARILAGRLAQAEGFGPQFGAAPATERLSESTVSQTLATPRIGSTSRDRRMMQNYHRSGVSSGESSPLDTTVWAQAYGDWGRRDGDGGAGAFSYTTKGVMIGADRALGYGGQARLGVAMGYAHDDSTQHGTSRATGDTDSYSLSLYGGMGLGPVALRAGGIFGWHEISTDRSVAFTGFEGQQSASYHAQTIQGFIEAARAFGNVRRKIEPFANLTFGYANRGSFTETGNEAALTSGSSDVYAGAATLGVRGTKVWSLSGEGRKIGLNGEIGWRHALGDLTPNDTMSFVNSATTFRTEGAEQASDSLLLGAGVDYDLTRSASLNFGYKGLLAESDQTNAVHGGVSMKF